MSSTFGKLAYNVKQFLLIPVPQIESQRVYIEKTMSKMTSLLKQIYEHLTLNGSLHVFMHLGILFSRPL